MTTLYLCVSALCSRCSSNDKLEAAVRSCPWSIKEACWLVCFAHSAAPQDADLCARQVSSALWNRIMSRCTWEDKCFFSFFFPSLSPAVFQIHERISPGTQIHFRFHSTCHTEMAHWDHDRQKTGPKGAEGSRGHSDRCAVPLSASAGLGRGQGWGARG